MSAYICEKKHLLYLITSAMSHTLSRGGGSFSWYHEGSRHELPAGDYERAAEVANMLWLENIRSVSHRHPGDKSSATLPGPAGGSFLVTAHDFRDFYPVNPVQVLKSANCLEYQSCEHPAWRASEAHAFLDAIRGAAVRVLPGYDEAIWGAPEVSGTTKGARK